MRCYFMRAGHIAGVEEMPGLSDEEAVAKAREIFEARKPKYEGFEVWKRNRMILQEPPALSAQIIDFSLKRSG